MQAPISIDIWHWPLISANDRSYAHAETFLSDDERQRADRMLSLKKRKEFILARVGLRLILANELSCNTKDLAFTYGAHGKPSMEMPLGVAPLHFNLAHSGGIAVLAITRSCPIGIDIEQHRKVDPKLAYRFFTNAEWMKISEAESQTQTELFFRFWTLKEALLKATGDGIQRGLDSFEIDFDDETDENVRLVRMEGINEPNSTWTLKTFDLKSDMSSAVAVPIGNTQLSLRPISWDLETALADLRN